MRLTALTPTMASIIGSRMTRSRSREASNEPSKGVNASGKFGRKRKPFLPIFDLFSLGGSGWLHRSHSGAWKLQTNDHSGNYTWDSHAVFSCNPFTLSFLVPSFHFQSHKPLSFALQVNYYIFLTLFRAERASRRAIYSSRFCCAKPGDTRVT